MLSTTAEYALRIMIFLAESEGERFTGEEIAEATKVTPGYTVKVLRNVRDVSSVVHKAAAKAKDDRARYRAVNRARRALI